ncbi:MAG: class II aldolase/adducin family protein, partial [Marinilabiliales bacterium]|nr:class II aldolase/adducin family protein [Marinilabiliales bacterium]
ESLVTISRFYGSDSKFVLAGGGNTSVKDEETICIKASGTSLATIDEEGFVTLSRKKLEVIREKVYSSDPLVRENEVKVDLHAAILYPAHLRPSVETSLHDLIPYRFVVHTHPTLVNGLMCANQAQKFCRDLFGEEALFVPYTDPGYVLFKEVAQAISQFSGEKGFEPKIIFLENHGVFVGADTTEEIVAIYDQIMATLQSRLSDDLPAVVRSLPAGLDQIIPERLHPEWKGFVPEGFCSELADRFLTNEASFGKADTAFTPDDIVYCKAHYLYVPAAKGLSEQLNHAAAQVKDFKAHHGYLPKVLALGGVGIVAIEDCRRSALNVLDVYENILKISCYAENFGGPKFLNEAQISFIDNWEVENYRRKVAKS